jgi:hypothetical protein
MDWLLCVVALLLILGTTYQIAQEFDAFDRYVQFVGWLLTRI